MKNLTLSLKRSFYSRFLHENSKSPRKLWNFVSTLLSKKESFKTPTFRNDVNGASEFAEYFSQKIVNVCETLSPSCATFQLSPVTASPFFDHFEEMTMEEIVKLLNKMNSKTCMLDPIPSWVIKLHPTVFAPVLCFIVNLSMMTGVFPISEKCAVITPILKKRSLNKEDLQNYRPVSQLSFVSKLIESAVSAQIKLFLTTNNLYCPNQSAYRKSHSTETVLVHLCNEISVTRSVGMSSCLLLLDLSAAFETVNHEILLERLASSFYFSGTVLNWLRDYLLSRSQFVKCSNQLSSVYPITGGVPQGSVLGPLLYSLYVSPLSDIINDYNLLHHIYADDTCIFISFRDQIPFDLPILENCVSHVCDWFNWNRLKVNPSKTDLLVFSSDKKFEPVIQVNVCGHIVKSSLCVKYLGILFDKKLSFDNHVIEMCRSSFIFLRSLYRISKFLDTRTLLLVINAFVFSRLDYCNSVLSFCHGYSVKRLQRVQNCFARLVKRLPRSASVSSSIRELGWLRIEHRISFKILCLVHKCLYGAAPSYLRSLLSMAVSSGFSFSLRSHSTVKLFCPISRSAFVRRSFSFYAPRLWNALPVNIRSERRYDVFRSLLIVYMKNLFIYLFIYFKYIISVKIDNQ
ncbi:MAG: reverse transcriptase family protein [Pseudomonadota bacterium]